MVIRIVPALAIPNTTAATTTTATCKPLYAEGDC